MFGWEGGSKSLVPFGPKGCLFTANSTRLFGFKPKDITSFFLSPQGSKSLVPFGPKAFLLVANSTRLCCFEPNLYLLGLVEKVSYLLA